MNYKFKTKPYAHQLKALEMSHNKEVFAYFMEMGTGKSKVLLKEGSQIIFSPGPAVFELRRLLKNYRPNDYLILSGDPAVIGLACAIASDINNGRFNLLKWDRQEKVYYPLEIDLYEKGKIDE